MVASINLFATGEISGTTAGEYIKVGGAGAQFLKIGVGARANGMGGAYSSLGGDMESVYWNPAGIADIKTYGASFAYTQCFGGFQHNYTGVSAPLSERFTVGINFTSFTSDDMMYTTLEYDKGTGSFFRESDYAIGILFGGYLTDQFSFGVNAKFIQSGIASMQSSGLAADIGTMYESGIYGIKLGFAILNLGTQQEYRGQNLKTSKKLYEAINANPVDAEYIASDFSIPLIFRAGFSGDLYNEGDYHCIGAFDFAAFSDIAEQYTLGTEFAWKNILAARIGYRLGSDQLRLSLGAGIKYNSGGVSGMFDYAYMPSVSLGAIHRISVSIGGK